MMSVLRCRGRASVRFFMLLVVLVLSSCSCTPESNDTDIPAPYGSKPVPVYTYRIINTYAHDPDAFTEGLAFENGILYEGTGEYGNSSIRKVDLETGAVLQSYRLPSSYFGEGITVYKDTIIQLTWESHTGFIYDKNSFELLREFSYPTEGWGITYDGESIIMSDGTSILHFLDPVTLKTTGYIEVHDNNVPIDNINELEYINGRLYVNIWHTERIAIIDPRDGSVTGWIDLTGLLDSRGYNSPAYVLNGIAYDAQADRLFVTGKFWPLLFEIKLVEKEQG